MTDNILSGRMDEALRDARLFADRAMMKQAVADSRKRMGNPDVQSMEAIGVLKANTDKLDKFLIYRISQGTFSTGGMDYVFKTSKAMLDLMLEMDRDAEEESLMKGEPAFFDGTFNRAKGFVTLNLWCNHKALSMMLLLASMEVKKEDAQNIATFFRLLNEVRGL